MGARFRIPEHHALDIVSYLATSGRKKTKLILSLKFQLICDCCTLCNVLRASRATYRLNINIQKCVVSFLFILFMHCCTHHHRPRARLHTLHHLPTCVADSIQRRGLCVGVPTVCRLVEIDTTPICGYRVHLHLHLHASSSTVCICRGLVHRCRA